MTTATKKRTQSRALPWFGADTMVADRSAALLHGCKHVTIPFCGGLSIARCLVEQGGVNEIVCGDLHHHAINLFAVLSDPCQRKELVESLSITPFSERLLEQAQDVCKRVQPASDWPNRDLALQYFVTAWMGRSGKAGTDSEFNGGLAMRWDAGGGSSPLRFQTAVRSIQEVWGPICERCSFLCRDWREIVGKVKDSPDCGLYVDPPWVGAGDSYVHKFTERDHSDLAEALRRFQQTKVVVRYGDEPLIRELYCRDRWRIRPITSRDQANGATQELCITNFSQIADEVPAYEAHLKQKEMTHA